MKYCASEFLSLAILVTAAQSFTDRSKEERDYFRILRPNLNKKARFWVIYCKKKHHGKTTNLTVKEKRRLVS